MSSTDTQHIRLSEEFIAPYKTQLPDFGALGYITYLRTYSREVVGEEGSKRMEEWWETVRRVVEGNINLDPRLKADNVDPALIEELTKEAEALYDAIFWLKMLPPGRGLWMSGTEFALETGDGLVNCWGIACKPQAYEGETEPKVSFPFVFLLDESMKGGGVGFSVERKNLAEIPPVQSRIRLIVVCDESHSNFGELASLSTFPEAKFRLVPKTEFRPSMAQAILEVPDSREGWGLALRHVIDSHWELPDKSSLAVDVSKIRPRGTPIKRFGGVAAGPSPLVDLLVHVNYVLNRRFGQRLTSVDCTDIFNMIGRCVVAGNVRRCLPKGTLVHTQRGLVPIEQVKIGDMVQTSSGYHEVTDWVYQGEQVVLTIKTQMGEFKCTPRHKIAVMDGIGSYTWKKAYELKPGDRMVFVDHILDGVKTSLPAWSYDKPAHSTTCVDITIPELDADMSWFFGYFHGNGYVYPNFEKNGFNAYVMAACPAGRQDIAGKLKEQMARFGVNLNIVGPSEKDASVKIRAISKQLAWYMSQFKKAGESISVPDFILQGTSNIRAAYLAGLYDADGSVGNRPLVAVSSVYPDFLHQVQALYASLGIPTRIRLHRKGDGAWQDLYWLTVVGEKAVRAFEERVAPFSLKYVRRRKTHRSPHDYGYPREFILDKVDYGKAWTPQSKQMTVATLERVTRQTQTLIPVEVLDVVYNEEIAETYDISVDSAHEFVAQGYLVHNTAEIAVSDCDDLDFARMKNWELAETEWDKWAVNNHRWASNNSLIVDDPGFYDSDTFQEVVKSVQVNGEPGFLNRYLARDYGRIVDGEQPGKNALAEIPNPCSEQFLESGEPCNLFEFFPYNAERMGYSFEEGLRLAARYCKRVTFANYTWGISQEVISRNRRFGVSLSGLQDWILYRFGKAIIGWEEKDGQLWPVYNPELTMELDRMYHIVEAADEEYSRELGCDKSISLTCTKPSGTVALVANGQSPGIHWHYFDYGIRRVRFASDSPLVGHLRELGYPVEPALHGTNTVVVEFPFKAQTADLAGFRSASEVPIEEQFANQALFQRYWADAMVSCTITFHEHEREKIPGLLAQYRHMIKSTSLLPYSGHGYAQAPYEPTSKEEYERRMSQIKPWQSLMPGQTLGDDIDDSAECAGGVCPIR